VKLNKEKCIALVVVFSVAFLNGCDNKIAPASESTCLTLCQADWKNDYKSVCPIDLTSSEQSCLASGTAACPYDENGNVYGPVKNCKDADDSNQQTGTTQSTTATPINVNFRVVKIDVTDPAVAVYANSIIQLKTIYPQSTFDPNKSTTQPALSYNRALTLLHKTQPKIDQFTALASDGTVKTAQVIKYTDEWYIPAAGDKSITNTTKCGDVLPVRNYLAVTYDPQDPNSKVNWNYDWANGLFKSSPAVSAYNSTYQDNSGKEYLASVFLLDSKGLFVQVDKDGFCHPQDIDPSLLSTFTSPDLAPIASAPPGSSEKVDPGWLSYSEAMDFKGIHNAIVAVYMNNITNTSLLDKNCSTWQDLFATAISHEIGHHLLSAGHDPDAKMWMNATNSCQTQQALPYTDDQHFTVSSPSETQLNATIGGSIWVP